MSSSLRLWVCRLGFVSATLQVSGVAAGQSSRPLQKTAALAEPTSSVDLEPSTSDIDRIRTRLDGPAILKLDSVHLRFYVTTIERQRTFADYVEGYDFLNGPTPGRGAISHREIVNQMMPHEAPAIAMVGLSFDPGRIKDAIRGYVREFKTRRIRDRITRELEALSGDRISRRQ